jgi:transcriptional regulator with XRE-family HTH domain
MPRDKSDPVDKYVGARLKMRRLMLEMSQENLGDRLGLSFQQVQKYEKGTNRMSSSRLHQAADILGVPVTFFFEGAPGQDKAGKRSVPDYVSDFVSSSDGLALIKAFMQIKSGKVRRAVVLLVENMAGGDVA